MHTFKSAHECESLEDFVKEHYRIKFNKGRRGISLDNLKDLADGRNLKYKSNITRDEFAKLKRRDFFEVVAYDEVQMYGKYVSVPLYSAEQFFNMTREKIDEALDAKVPRKQKPTA